MKLNNKGFTLIELLAVIVILALLIVVAAGRVTTALDNSKKSALKTEAQKILNQKLSEIQSAKLLKPNPAEWTNDDVVGFDYDSKDIAGEDGTYSYTIYFDETYTVKAICIEDGTKWKLHDSLLIINNYEIKSDVDEYDPNSDVNRCD